MRKNWRIGMLVLVVLVLAIGGGYWWQQRQQAHTQQVQQDQSSRSAIKQRGESVSVSAKASRSSRSQRKAAQTTLPFTDAKPLQHIAFISDLIGRDVGFANGATGYYLRLNPDGTYWLRAAGTFREPKHQGNYAGIGAHGRMTDILYLGRYQAIMPGEMTLSLTGQIAFLFNQPPASAKTVEAAFASHRYVHEVAANTSTEVIEWSITSAKENLGFPLVLHRENGRVTLTLLIGNQPRAFTLAASDGQREALGPTAFVAAYGTK